MNNYPYYPRRMADGGSTSDQLLQTLNSVGMMSPPRGAPTGGKGGMRPPASTGLSLAGKGGGTTMVERVPQGAMMGGMNASSLESLLGGMNFPQPRPMGPAGNPVVSNPKQPFLAPGMGEVYGRPVGQPAMMRPDPQNGGIAELRQLFLNRSRGQG